MTDITVATERVDDVPILIGQQMKMGIPEVIDQEIEPHGNRQGLSVGWLVTSWLSYVLSAADHRMNRVEPWAEGRLGSLQALLPGEVGVKDFTDDRLADCLVELAQDESWEAIEHQLNQRQIRVYGLSDEPVRLDTTTVSVHHAADEEGLFGFGHSKDHRPDLAQFKLMWATLDPLGMPLVTLVVAGERADDGLYAPAIRRCRASLGAGKLYVGDSKMAALSTRAFVRAGDDHYLTPLPRTGQVPELLEELLVPVWRGEQALQPIHLQRDEGDDRDEEQPGQLVGLGFECEREQEAEIEKRTQTWEERLLVVYSPSLAKRARAGLEQRLDNALQALAALTPPRGRGRRQWQELAPLAAEVGRILNQHRVENLLQVDYHLEVERRPVRRYGDRPARTEERHRYVLRVQRHLSALRQARRLLGWRLYVTTAPADQLSLGEAFLTYRDAPIIERGFRRLKNHPLGLSPLYVQRQDHATGLARLLSLGLRVLTSLEFVVRQALQTSQEELVGLYAGNPKRTTARPTAERLLEAFQEITLSRIALPDQIVAHITPLSQLQRRILDLLRLPAALYEVLVSPDYSFPFTAPKLSEP